MLNSFVLAARALISRRCSTVYPVARPIDHLAGDCNYADEVALNQTVEIFLVDYANAIDSDGTFLYLAACSL